MGARARLSGAPVGTDVDIVGPRDSRSAERRKPKPSAGSRSRLRHKASPSCRFLRIEKMMYCLRERAGSPGHRVATHNWLMGLDVVVEALCDGRLQFGLLQFAITEGSTAPDLDLVVTLYCGGIAMGPAATECRRDVVHRHPPPCPADVHRRRRHRRRNDRSHSQLVLAATMWTGSCPGGNERRIGPGADLLRLDLDILQRPAGVHGYRTRGGLRIFVDISLASAPGLWNSVAAYRRGRHMEGPHHSAQKSTIRLGGFSTRCQKRRSMDNQRMLTGKSQ